MNNYIMSYREVIPDQTVSQTWKEIALNTGASQSTLQDIKVAEKAGGFCYKNVTKIHNRNRFIYWRTSHDILELSEVSLDLNLTDNNVRYKFADSPVLTVAIFENQNFIVILVATVNSIHRLSFSHPDRLQRNYGNLTMQSMSVFHDASANSTRDPSTFYVIGHAASSNYQIPHTAACWLLPDGQSAVFSLAYQTTLMLFNMNCVTGQTISTELKQHIVPRIFSNITGALRGKTNSTDNQYVTSLVFGNIDNQTFLYALYRDDNIRMWSIKTSQCLSTVNCLPDGIESRTQGPQSNSLRHASESMLGVFLCHSLGSEFITIEIQWDGNNTYTLLRNNLIAAPQYDLVDFEINATRIWALWCNSQGEFNISSYFLTPGYSKNWVPAALESPPDRYSVTVEHGMDPRQTYCSYIFHPGKFQRSVIAKALVMFRRANVLADSNLPMPFLKDRVCQAIESEIQNEIKDFEITDEEYIDISLQFWERFYSCCEQYHVKASQPLGLVTMDAVGAVCVVKKNAFSVLRPCERLEHLMLTGDATDELQHLFGEVMTIEEPKLYQGLVQLVSILALLDQHIGDDIKTEIDNKLYQLQIPNAIMGKIVSDMMSTEYDETIFQRDFMVRIHQEIKSIADLPKAMILLLESLRMDYGEMDSKASIDFSRIGNLFGSDIGISLVSESLRQIALIRYALCRNLLILQHILIDTFDLQSNILEVIRSRCMPETVIFVQAYYVMVWLGETPAQSTPPSSSIENSLQRLNIYPLYDGLRTQNRNQQPITLLELFLRGHGIHTGLQILVQTQSECISNHQWQVTLLPLVTIIGQLVWAVSGNFVFGEWLISSCQHILIQEYVRLLNSWCEWNNCSRHFIAAISLIDNGETHKAFDLFMKAGKGVLTEPFLEKIILDSNLIDNCTYDQAMKQYYLKVIQLFEQHSALDYVIELAKAAIGILDKSDPQLPMFQCIVFANHLKLEHYTEAYHSLIDNVESSHRKDCLRKLVVCLFEEKRLDLLMQFPYKRLQDDLEDIVESRARFMSIEDNAYYNFLYSFYVTKGNMRKAATIMYEQAMRFALEYDTAAAIQSRYECLLSCLNALHLVDEKYAWIAKPVLNQKSKCINSAINNIDINQDDDDDDNDDTMNNDYDNDRIDIDQQKCDQHIMVLEIKDIEQELLLTEAILSLAKHRQELTSILHADADQLIAVLTNTGLYTSAIKLAERLNKSIVSILENLTSACIRAGDESTNDAWAWLQENDLADLPHKNNAIDMAWKLLERLINDHECKNSTILHKAVTGKILSLGEFVPTWLQLSYRKLNATELLNLYVTHGHFIDGAQFAIEYIWSMIRSGGEYFGLRNSMQSIGAALCFPINSIDLLLYGLKMNTKHDHEYQQWFDQLTEVVNYYVDIANRMSKDKIQYEHNRITNDGRIQ